MKALAVSLIVIACSFSCAAPAGGGSASGGKPATPAVVAPPLPLLRLKADGPSVAYAVPAGWIAIPAEKPVEPVILGRPGDKDDAIAMVLQETDLSDKLEEVTARWAMLAATMVTDFHATALEAPTYPSEGESSFIIRGEDAAKRPIVLIVRLKNVGDPSVDFWAIVMLTGRADQVKELTEIGDNLVKSLKVKAPEPPK